MEQTEVDGVRTLLAPASGPVRAGLIFRVGRADETLARSGVTHLLEHLVLHPVGLADYHYNGATGTVVTHFHTQGSAQDVVAFLSGVCAALSDLPLDRMDIEKEVLRTEAGNRAPHVTEPLAVWRHGARDHGLRGYPEWGLSMVTADDLRGWAARYFTRDNAVLWVAGSGVPQGLTLTLPGGTPQPVPVASSALPASPAYFAGTSAAVALDAVIPRSAAGSVFAGVWERELFRTLRQESGLSYTAAATYEPRGDGAAVVTALADALPEKQDAVLGEFIDVLAKLRIGRIEQADVDAVVARVTGSLTTAEAPAARLPSQAFDLLTGKQPRSVEEALAELGTVTVDAVRAVVPQVVDSALLMVPEGRRADWAGFVAAPMVSETVVTGAAHASLAGDDVKLVVGPEGVSLVADDDAVTVRYDACAAMLAWPDGARLLVGVDGFTTRLEPTLYQDGAAPVATVDAAVPAAVQVTMPARAPSQIPQPAPNEPREESPPQSGSGCKLFFVGALALVIGLVSAFFTLVTVLESADDPAWWIMTAGLWLVTGLLLTSVVRTFRGIQRRT